MWSVLVTMSKVTSWACSWASESQTSATSSTLARKERGPTEEVVEGAGEEAVEVLIASCFGVGNSTGVGIGVLVLVVC